MAWRRALATALPAVAAQAFTFTESAHFAYSGNVSFLSGPTVVDTNNGFVLRGDYQLGTGVSFLIHVFASWYMRGEEGYSRFFAYMNLFVASMVLLVLARR